MKRKSKKKEWRGHEKGTRRRREISFHLSTTTTKTTTTRLKTKRDCEDENMNELREWCRIMIILYYEMSVITCKKKRVLICL